MKKFEIALSPNTEDDLRSIYDWVATHASHATAAGFIRKIEAKYRSLAHFPERGTRYDRLMPGLRIIGMGSRVSIVFRVEETRVAILRILYGGRDLESALDELID